MTPHTFLPLVTSVQQTHFTVFHGIEWQSISQATYCIQLLPSQTNIFPCASNAKSGNRKGNRKPVQSGAKKQSCCAPNGSKSYASNRRHEESVNRSWDWCLQSKHVIAPHKSAALRCDTCHSLFHGECLGDDHLTLTKFVDVAHITGWVCAAWHNVQLYTISSKCCLLGNVV